MSHDWNQDYITIGATLSQAPVEVLDELGGTEAEVAKAAAQNIPLDEVCERLNLRPDQVWAMVNEALDRIQGIDWSTGPSGDIRPMDAGNIQRPVQGI